MAFSVGPIIGHLEEVRGDAKKHATYFRTFHFVTLAVTYFNGFLGVGMVAFGIIQGAEWGSSAVQAILSGGGTGLLIYLERTLYRKFEKFFSDSVSLSAAISELQALEQLNGGAGGRAGLQATITSVLQNMVLNVQPLGGHGAVRTDLTAIPPVLQQ